jgi:DUF4097 and DUF4098 domain-containing protein YvlB
VIAMMSRLSVSAGLLAVAFLSVACDINVGKNGLSVDVAHGKANDEWKRSYKVTPGGRLDIVNVSGPMTLLASTGPDVEIVATREVRAATDEAAGDMLKKSQMVEQVSPDRVSIESRPDRGNGIGQRMTVDITARVPAGLIVSLKTQDGGVRFEGVTGTIAAQTVNGPIVGRDVDGAVTASTTNGGIRVEIAKLTANSSLTTVNGPVELAVADDLNAALEAHVVNGAVLVAEGFPLAATERTGQRVAGTMNKGGPTIVAQTTNGAVRLKTGKLDFFEGPRGRGRRGPPPPPRP